MRERDVAGVKQRVTMYGDERASRTALVLHALTGSSRVADWWPGIAGGEQPLFDAREWRIVGINALGSCYGSTGPANVPAFSRVTVRDVVRAQRLALRELGIERVDVAIGGSLGGMQALQWAIDAPQRIGRAVIVGAHDHHSAMGVAFNALQREAIALDPVRGLRLARKMATLTYKHVFAVQYGSQGCLSMRSAMPCVVIWKISASQRDVGMSVAPAATANACSTRRLNRLERRSTHV